MPTDRRRLQANLDEDTYDQWHAFTDAFNLTISSFCEGLGRNLDPTGRQSAFLRKVIADSSIIQAQRTDRRQPD